MVPGPMCWQPSGQSTARAQSQTWHLIGTVPPEPIPEGMRRTFWRRRCRYPVSRNSSRWICRNTWLLAGWLIRRACLRSFRDRLIDGDVAPQIADLLLQSLGAQQVANLCMRFDDAQADATFRKLPVQS